MARSELRAAAGALAFALAITAASPAARADGSTPWDGKTIGIQVGAGIGGGLVGSVVGGGVAYVSTRNDHGLDALGYFAVSIGTGAVIGSITGVQVAGDGRHGTGSLVFTSIGGVAGAASFCLATWQLPDSVTDHEPWWALLPTLTIAGEIIGYHASAHDPRPSPIMLSLAHGAF